MYLHKVFSYFFFQIIVLNYDDSIVFNGFDVIVYKPMDINIYIIVAQHKNITTNIKKSYGI